MELRKLSKLSAGIAFEFGDKYIGAIYLLGDFVFLL